MRGSYRVIGDRRVWRGGVQEIFAGENLIITSNPSYANLNKHGNCKGPVWKRGLVRGMDKRKEVWP